MARWRGRKKTVSKYENDAVLVSVTVTEIIEQNKEYENGKLKNVFKAVSKSGNERMCIQWGRSLISVGCEVQMKGRIKDDVFLVWSAMIVKNPNKERATNG